jgi:AcrR family transcriptional regulator
VARRQHSSSDGATTRERILDASRRLFNERGYLGTTTAAIAAEVGIAEGNLYYHFRTKLDLVRALNERVRARERGLREAGVGSSVEDLASGLLSSLRNTWSHHFLFRDAALFRRSGLGVHRDPDIVAGLGELEGALRRMDKDGLFRRDADVDLADLARLLWMVGRYWPDYLREVEGADVQDLCDEERGVRQHLAVLLPWLTADGRRKVRAAFAAAQAEWDAGAPA